MEVSVQSTDSLRIKGKSASVYINPVDKTAAYNAAILLGNPAKSSLKIRDDVVVIDGPGEYEAGGIKITGTKSEEKTVYSINVDGIDILLGDRDAIDANHQKLKEQNILIIHAESAGNSSFASALGLNSTLVYGAHALEVVDSIAKDTKKELGKYSVSAGKFPPEVETVLLASS